MLWCFGMNERRSVHFIIHRDMLIQLYNKIIIKKKNDFHSIDGSK